MRNSKTLPGNRGQRIQALFEAARGLSPAQQASFLDQACAGNTSNIGDDEAPASAGPVNVGGSVVQLAAGFPHTCALLDTGAVPCWGEGDSGQLGYGNTIDIGDNEAPASAGDVNVGG